MKYTTKQSRRNLTNIISHTGYINNYPTYTMLLDALAFTGEANRRWKAEVISDTLILKAEYLLLDIIIEVKGELDLSIALDFKGEDNKHLSSKYSLIQTDKYLHEIVRETFAEFRKYITWRCDISEDIIKLIANKKSNDESYRAGFLAGVKHIQSTL